MLSVVLRQALMLLLTILPVSIIYAFAWRRYRKRGNKEGGYEESSRHLLGTQLLATGVFTLCAFDFMMGLTMAVPGGFSVGMMFLGLIGAFIATAVTLNY